MPGVLFENITHDKAHLSLMNKFGKLDKLPSLSSLLHIQQTDSRVNKSLLHLGIILLKVDLPSRREDTKVTVFSFRLETFFRLFSPVSNCQS